MNIALHKRARTAPAVRREIQWSKLSERKLAEKYGISGSTVRKRKYRDTAEDFSHRPHNPHATLTDPEEAVVIELRGTLLLPIDDLLAVVRELVCPYMSRSALDRRLRRHGVSNLKELIPTEKNEKNHPKTFKDYEPGFMHADIKYLPGCRTKPSGNTCSSASTGRPDGCTWRSGPRRLRNPPALF